MDAFDARWQTGAVVRGLYLADCEDTAWEEWLRATADLGVPPTSRLPRAMCPLEADLDRIADLTSPLLSPSAAHEGHTVLTAFRTGPDIPGVLEGSPVTVHDAIPRIPTGLRT